MPAIAVHGNPVLSKTGTGRNCPNPTKIKVDACQTGLRHNVKIGGELVVVEGDLVEAHNLGGCGPDTNKLSTFSDNIKIGGKRVGRIGDQYGEDNIIIQGSSKVFGG
jgi:uncharacterized Zn-binding protein involved in type VI secretion